MRYNRCGRSGLDLPAISLGLWQNFGHDRPLETSRAIVRRAFDLGITHFDLANNYGPPYGSAEENFGRLLAQDLRPYRDELVISSKAGYDMWPGPYGDHGSRKYLLASLDQSLQRLGLDYVDIFYSHRADPARPRHAAAHPPAVVLDVEPVDRGRPARRARRPRRRLHRLLAARPGHAHRQVPRRHPRRFPRRTARIAVSRAAERRGARTD